MSQSNHRLVCQLIMEQSKMIKLTMIRKALSKCTVLNKDNDGIFLEQVQRNYEVSLHFASLKLLHYFFNNIILVEKEYLLHQCKSA